MLNSIYASLFLPVLVLTAAVDLQPLDKTLPSPEHLTNLTVSNGQKFVDIISEEFVRGAVAISEHPEDLNVYESSLTMHGVDQQPDLVNYRGASYSLMMIRKINQPQWWESFSTAAFPPDYMWIVPVSNYHSGQPLMSSFDWDSAVRQKMDIPQAWQLVLRAYGKNLPKYDSFSCDVMSLLGEGPRYYFRIWESSQQVHRATFVLEANVMIATGKVEIKGSEST